MDIDLNPYATEAISSRACEVVSQAPDRVLEAGAALSSLDEVTPAPYAPVITLFCRWRVGISVVKSIVLVPGVRCFFGGERAWAAR